MSLIWLPEAKKDLERLFKFLVEKNPTAAEKAMLSIDEAADQLLKFPESGVLMQDRTNRRQSFIPMGKSVYVLRYIIYENIIVIIRVWHAKEQRL